MELSGRDLDREIAEKVFGEPEPKTMTECHGHWSYVQWEGGGEALPFPFSSHIETAWLVVEKMLKMRCTYLRLTGLDEWFEADFEVDHKSAGLFQSPSVAEAICVAALQALESTGTPSPANVLNAE